MALNITNIVDAVNAKNTNADSNTSDTEIRLVNTAITLLNGTDGVITYKSREELPAPDSANNGQFVFIPATAQEFLDSYGDGAFFWSSGDSWNPMQLVREAVANSTGQGLYYNRGTALTNQGTVSGYISGAGIAPTFSNVIEKFSFTSDGNATDVGDLTITRGGTAGQSSSTHGYNSGGANTDPTAKDVIDKFSFSADGNATDAGDLSQARYLVTGQTSLTHGYSSGGYTKAYPGTRYNNIDKFPFASDGNATDVGDLTEAGHSAAGASSTTHGYNAGRAEPSVYNIIDKFSFSVDGNATDVGDLATTLHSGAGNSSTSHGYSSGGRVNPTSNSNVIQKYPFSTDANATDVGDLTQIRAYLAGQSSTTHGYSSGGNSPPTKSNVIDKFTFSSDANATDVGDATISERARTGQQV